MREREQGGILHAKHIRLKRNTVPSGLCMTCRRVINAKERRTKEGREKGGKGEEGKRKATVENPRESTD